MINMANTNEITTNIITGQREIAATTAFLIGVPIENIGRDPQMADRYRWLKKNERSAQIVRALCIARTNIMKQYKDIQSKMSIEGKTASIVTNFIDASTLDLLVRENVSWMKKSCTAPEHYIIELNKYISDRINNCKKLFPLWLKWEYVRELFIMPNGFTKAGVKDQLFKYSREARFYPFQVYLNWEPEDVGNIFYDDLKFVSTIYNQHNTVFSDTTKVRDVGGFVKEKIYDFIQHSQKLIVAVDCENTDPYKLFAALKGLPETLSKRISKVILFDDVNTCSTWKVLESYIQIPVEYKLVERVTKFKSLVDITLTATISKEHYMNDVDSFLLVSSDSDYWGMISTLTNARFLLMVERDSCGDSLKTVLRDSKIFFCYLDDFYSGNDTIKYSILLKEIQSAINEIVHLNIKDVMAEAITKIRAPMTEAEKEQLYTKHLKKISMSFDDAGNLQLTI